MKRSLCARTVRFEPEQFARLQRVAEEQGKPLAEVMRAAIAAFLDGQPKLSASELRHLRVTEFMQVALDAMIRQEYPELRETLVLEADRRMKLHHGA